MLISSAIKFQEIGSNYFQIMCGKRHADIFQRMFQLGIKYNKKTYETGFLTDNFQFLNRKDAASEALESGQIKELIIPLFSEDVWPPDNDY